MKKEIKIVKKNKQTFEKKMFNTDERKKGRQNVGDERKIDWFVGFYGISTFQCYLTANPFLCK